AEEGRRIVEPALGRELDRTGLRLVEVAAVLDQLGPERQDGGVLLDRIAVRHPDRQLHPGARAREGERLAVIAAGRADDARDMRTLAFEAVDVDKAAADLEGAGRRVVLVLDHDLDAGARLE